MKILLLGTAGYHPSERRHTPCLLIPECSVMLDAGTGLFRAVPYLQPPRLDIFLTHAHLDHIVGLTYLLSVLYLRPLERVCVHGTPATLKAIREHLFAPAIFPVAPPFEFCPLVTDKTDLRGSGVLTYFPLKHPGGSIGYRLEWPGHSLAYVTDTTAEPDAPYLDRIRGVDLLLHECYLPDQHAEFARKTGHSHTTPVAEVARRAGVGRLVLVHLNPMSTEDDPIGLDAARAIFPRTTLGEDGMEVEF
jgi:ribonuclease BN (tRNA processing enzyme)